MAHRTTFQEASARMARDTRTLGSELLRRARRHPRRIAIQDAGGTLDRLRLAGVALALGPRLGLGQGETHVGLLLPPGRGGTLANVAVTLAGRTSVNLNHTAGAAQLARMCQLAGVRTIVSSTTYLERIAARTAAVELPPGVRLVALEDVLPALPKAAVVLQMARVMALPPSWIDRNTPDTVATVLFSSGTTGDPKGVQLTHRQLLANADALLAHMQLRPDEGGILSPLPLFHSFGFCPGLWMPLAYGLRVAGQPDPFDAAALGELARASGVDLLISTPTFARGYVRRIPPEHFAALRYGIVSAERCPDDLHDAFENRFAGARLLEAYGATELAPGVAVNPPDAPRRGSVGIPLPGIEIVVVDPATFEPLPPGAEGLLVVRSPSRMRGYLGRDDLTEQAFLLGGYNTGDVGRIDEDGYLHLTGRLARFAKLGGEMVPLDHVEGALQEAVRRRGGGADVAVAAVADRMRGERLVVLHAGDLPAEPAALLDDLGELPPLWRPKANAFHRIDAIPVLGTGKRDLGALRRLAAGLEPTPVQRAADSARDAAERLAGRMRGAHGEAEPGADEPPAAASEPNEPPI